MASYTMQLREYIEQASQYEDGLSHRERIEIGRPTLFDFPYTFFDEDYKKIFETNFIRSFYFREIGVEVEESFKFRLETWVNINMGYYNKLFESELLQYDPLTNSDMTTEYDQTTDKEQNDNRTTDQTSQTDGNTNSKLLQDSTGEGTSKADNFNREVTSETPDERLELTTQQGKGIIEYANQIEENKTDNNVTSTSKNHNDSETNDTTNVTGNANQKDDLKSNVNELEHYLEKKVGKVGDQSYAKLVQEYRNSLLRIEKEMHRDMQELFMMVY